MTDVIERINNRAAEKLNAMTTAELVELFNETDSWDINDPGTPIMRGWIMDTLENRNQEGFDRYIDECGTPEEKPLMEYFQ